MKINWFCVGDFFFGLVLPITPLILALCLAVYALNKEVQARKYHEADEFIHDGWCSLMPKCHDRCHCHDECGPLCNTWRRLVYDGKVEPFGYEWHMNDPTGLVMCIIRNATSEPMRIVNEGVDDPNGWQAVDELMQNKNKLNDPQAWEEAANE